MSAREAFRDELPAANIAGEEDRDTMKSGCRNFSSSLLPPLPPASKHRPHSSLPSAPQKPSTLICGDATSTRGPSSP